MWRPSREQKKHDEQILIEDFLKSQRWNFKLLHLAEKPDTRYVVGSEFWSIEITSASDEWAMQEMAEQQQATMDEKNNKVFTDGPLIIPSIQAIIDKKIQKSYENSMPGDKKMLIIFNNWGFVQMDDVATNVGEINMNSLDVIGIGFMDALTYPTKNGIGWLRLP